MNSAMEPSSSSEYEPGRSIYRDRDPDPKWAAKIALARPTGFLSKKIEMVLATIRVSGRRGHGLTVETVSDRSGMVVGTVRPVLGRLITLQLIEVWHPWMNGGHRWEMSRYKISNRSRNLEKLMSLLPIERCAAPVDVLVAGSKLMDLGVSLDALAWVRFTSSRRSGPRPMPKTKKLKASDQQELMRLVDFLGIRRDAMPLVGCELPKR